MIIISAVTSGVKGWTDIEEFGYSKLDWLRKYVPLNNGILVDDTLARVISSLSVKVFQSCFQSWVESVSCVAYDFNDLALG